MFKTPQTGGSKKATPQQRGTQSAPTTVSVVSIVTSQLVVFCCKALYILLLHFDGHGFVM